MRHCFTLDLKDNAELIAAYKKYHLAVWPEILAGIKSVGITDMEIYLVHDRMFMVMETVAEFDMDRDMKKLSTLSRQTEWEELMWQFQKALPWAAPGEKWMPMERIFKLE